MGNNKIKLFDSIEKVFDLIPERQSQTIIIKGKKVCLARYNNEIFALQDNCPHSHASLGKGLVNIKGEIVCPLHSYCFDLKTGREYQQKCNDAMTWRIIEEEQGIFIEMD